MSTILKAKPMTAEEFEQLDPDLRFYLVRGELEPMPPPPGAERGAITLDVTSEVAQFVKQHGLGACFAAETGFVIEHDPDTVLGADLAFVSNERVPGVLPTGYVYAAPDLVAEVRSPSDRGSAVAKKMRRWIDAGVRLAWEVNPRTRTATVYRPGAEPQRLTEDDSLEGMDVLPGFSLPVRTIFSR